MDDRNLNDPRSLEAPVAFDGAGNVESVLERPIR